MEYTSELHTLKTSKSRGKEKSNFNFSLFDKLTLTGS